MSARGRLSIFGLGAIILAIFLLRGVGGLPAFGHTSGLYGAILNKIAVPQRHVTDVVTAVNFDYRGIDTVGEEFILFAAVAGVALLLRAERHEVEEETPRRVVDLDRETRSSDAVRALCLVLVQHHVRQVRKSGGEGHVYSTRTTRSTIPDPFTVELYLVAPTALFGLYVVTHGQLTPGGGFQGGVVLATAPLLIYLAGEYGTLRALSPTAGVDLLGALGAGGFVAIGVVGLIAGGIYLQNVVPLGPVGTVYSAGTIPLINLAVGLGVRLPPHAV